MLIISARHMLPFQQDARDRFVSGVVARLGEPAIRERWALHPKLRDRPEELRSEVERLIRRAAAMQFIGTNDVEAFIRLAAVAGPALRKRPAWGWITALLRANDQPPAGRMRIIAALLPEPERRLCFPGLISA